MSRNRRVIKKSSVKSAGIKAAAMMGAMVLASSPIIPAIGVIGSTVVMAAYSEDATVSTLDFTTMAADEVKIEKNTGTITVNGEEWAVDATSGKLRSRGSDYADAQFKTGTSISIPCSGKGTVTVEFKSASYCSITDGTTVQNYNSTSAEYSYDFGSGSGNVTITATGSGSYYLTSITKTEYAYEEEVIEEAKPTETITAEDTVADTTTEYSLSKYELSSKSYDFTTEAKANATVEKTIGETDIYYAVASTSNNGVSFDGTLRFRAGCTLYIPVESGATAATISMVCSGENNDRLMYIGSADSGYSVMMSKSEKSVTVGDITDYLVTVGDTTYLPVVSGGDLKIKTMSVTTYNPVNEVTVSGTVVGTSLAKASTITFTDANGKTFTGNINSKDGSYTAKVKRVLGNTSYTITVDSTDYAVTAETASVTLTGNSGTWTKNVELYKQDKATVSGKLTGISDASLLKGDLKATFVPTNSNYASVEVALTADGNGDYTFADAALVKNAEYSVVLTNADDYEVAGTYTYADSTSEASVAASMKAVQTVTGSFVFSDGAYDNVQTITFTNMSTPSYKYTFTVDSSNSYTANLRAGEYETSVTTTSGLYEAYDHVSVGDSAVSNDVYLQGEEDTSTVAYQSEIKVGANQQFATISKALKYIERMDRTDSQRVTIILTDAKYTEQVVVNTPNVTINSALDSGSTISWYYGVGYSYYSANSVSIDGKTQYYYDEAAAVDKYYTNTISQNPGHWGATVNLAKAATGFAAENIIFENSFNRYLTDEEVADGVGVGTMNSKVDRSAAGVDVKAYASKERAAALYIQADNTEYKNCQFLSSQDTIYTGDSSENSYFVNCTLEGTTDFICGDGNPVFDKCNLSIYGYSDKQQTGSMIIASKATAEHGYLFSNCNVVSTSYAGILPTTSNYLGRTWTRGTTVYFMNTTLESDSIINGVGYTNMSGDTTTVADSHFYEYGTKLADGTAVDTSSRVTGTNVMTDEEAAKVVMTDFFDGWTPSYYTATTDTTKKDDTEDTTKKDDTGSTSGSESGQSGSTTGGSESGSSSETTTKKTETMTLSANDASTVAKGSSATLNGFTLTSTGTKEITVDSSTKSTSDGDSFTQRIKLGEGCTYDAEAGAFVGNNISFTTTDGTTLTVAALSSSSSADRTLNVYDATGEIVATIAAPGTGLAKITVSLPNAGTYYVGSAASGVNIYFMEVKSTAEDSSSTSGSSTGSTESGSTSGTTESGSTSGSTESGSTSGSTSGSESSQSASTDNSSSSTGSTSSDSTSTTDTSSTESSNTTDTSATESKTGEVAADETSTSSDSTAASDSTSATDTSSTESTSTADTSAAESTATEVAAADTTANTATNTAANTATDTSDAKKAEVAADESKSTSTDSKSATDTTKAAESSTSAAASKEAEVAADTAVVEESQAKNGGFVGIIAAIGAAFVAAAGGVTYAFNKKRK